MDRGVHQKDVGNRDGMIVLSLNGLGVVKRSQDGEVNDRPRKTAIDGRRE
jgi:hypothetical protein